MRVTLAKSLDQIVWRDEPMHEQELVCVIGALRSQTDRKNGPRRRG